MTTQQIEKEWERLWFEIVKNKPKLKGPYPPKVILLRELLMAARFMLEKIEDGEHVAFHNKLYRKIMRFYDVNRPNYY